LYRYFCSSSAEKRSDAGNFFLVLAAAAVYVAAISRHQKLAAYLHGTSARPPQAIKGKTAGRERRQEMLYYALVFLVIALLAAAFGFGGIAIAFASVAKILFFVFIVLFLVSLITHVARRA
jgi:uncharacterized membrane protein YtjA (UPF0391 family)